MRAASPKTPAGLCISLSRVLPVALLLLVCSIAPCWAADGTAFFTKKDCTCTGFSIPSYDEAYLTDAPDNGYSALTCQYGGYAKIPSDAKGNGVQFEIHRESAQAALGEYADRQKVIVPYFEGVKNDKKRHLIEYVPPGPAYVSLLSTSPGTSGKSTIYNGQRAIIYKNTYYIFVSGMGYDAGDEMFRTTMDAAESCAKAIVDAKAGGTPAVKETTARLVVLGGEVTLNGNAVDPREGGVVLRDRDRIETSGWLSPGWGYLIYTDKTLLRVEPGSKFVYHPEWLDLNIGGLWYRADKQEGKFRINVPTAVIGPKGTLFTAEVSPEGTTDLYVYEGEVAFSDTGTKKTVTVRVGENATCSRGGLPSDPKTFDLASVDTWWERGPPLPAGAGEAEPVPTRKSAGFAGAGAMIACAAAIVVTVIRE